MVLGTTVNELHGENSHPEVTTVDNCSYLLFLFQLLLLPITKMALLGPRGPRQSCLRQSYLRNIAD